LGENIHFTLRPVTRNVRHSSDQPLRDDIHLLGDLLGETLRAQEGVELYEMVERVRALAKSARAGHAKDFDALAKLLAGLPTDAALPVARAFAHFLNLANVAEQHHRVRRRREYQRGAKAKPQRGSCGEVFGRLRSQGISADRLFEAVTSLRIELVLTAHPTEVMRRTLLQKQRRIADLLARLDHIDLTAPEKREAVDELRREITSSWETDEVRHERPTPLDEVKGGLFVFEQTLFDALPQFLRVLDEALRKHTGRALPLDAAPLRFGSWIGGDRDGNPKVTAQVTRDACLLSRWMACDLYIRELDALRVDLSMARGSEELEALAGCSFEPYRAVLKKVRDELIDARKSIDNVLAGRTGRIACPPLLETLMVCWRSLHETGNALIAGGRLLDLIRRVHCFGLTLVRLDIRQEASRHARLLDAMERGEPLGEIEKADLETFRMIEEIDDESLGAYVITMAREPADVLNVAKLQNKMRIVPLFETIDDLRHAGETIRRLLGNEEYRTLINNRQEVMIGYSDSSKEAGRFTAAWELYKAQEQIVAACREAGVELTLFHGRGGSVGRGGGPTYLAISSQPPGSVEGRLRVTVQGEMIQAEFGLTGIALRTFEVYTTATLDATLVPSDPPRPEWRASIEKMSEAAARGYRKIVYETPAFLDYFRTATPEIELAEMNIGSRPARRDTKKGVQSLRAIPWQFAWTQNRLLLPSWLGVDDAIDAAEGGGAPPKEWPFYRSTIELIEMVLAKAEAQIAAYYDRLLVPDELKPIGEELRRRLARTIGGVRRVTGHKRLLETNRVLRRSIDVRNPYVDPINLVQAEVLRRLRSGDESLRDAFVVTVNGIAAGMRNTG
jgi:phosphoenolpyruvate carboxylase